MNRKLVTDTGKFLRQIEARRNNVNITPNELKILYVLSEFKKPVGRREIAEVIGYNVGGVDSRSTISLDDAGLITKTPVLIRGKKCYSHKNDLEITEKGLKLIHWISTGKGKL